MNALKSQNADLFSRVNSLKKDLSERVNYIERLSNDNKRLIKEREKTERKIQEFEVSFDWNSISTKIIIFCI